MNGSLKTYYAAVLAAVISCGSLLLFAADNPKVIKKGGIPYKELWSEGDVREYLDLPYRCSLDDLSRKLRETGLVGDYQVLAGEYRPVLEEMLGKLSFHLRGNGPPVFEVCFYGSGAWNRACDELFKYITDTVSLWNRVPEVFKLERTDDAYVVTCVGKRNGSIRWLFDMKRVIAIRVESEFNDQTDAGNQELRIKEVDRVIRSVVALFEGKGKGTAVQK